MTLLNVSATGARLRGESLPETGADFLLRVEGVETFATVVWSRFGMCGLRFEEPLGQADIDHLRRLGGRVTASRLTPEEQAALDDWRTGKAR